jgi:hypothetical protein
MMGSWTGVGSWKNEINSFHNSFSFIKENMDIGVFAILFSAFKI